MTRLIDADALKKYIEDCRFCEKCNNRKRNCSYYCNLPDFLTEDWRRIIDEQETIDAIPVIYCKDCKHFAGDGMYCAYNIITRADKWCCNGEKTNDTAD